MAKATVHKPTTDKSTNPKTTTGLDQNIAGALCYALGWITGIIFLLIEKDNKFVRFHAIQSTILFLTFTALMWIIPFSGGLFLGLIGFGLSALLWPVEIILWAVLIFKAYQGETFKLPIIGKIAEEKSR